MSKLRPAVVPLVLILSSAVLLAQDNQSPPGRVEFEVVSIKRHTADERAIGMRNLPDGTSIMTNMPISTALARMAPVPMRDVIGLPDWVTTERYDIETKPRAGTPRNQQKPMWEALFADRMKLAAHTEQRERDIYALVLARSDGKLGPEMKASTLDCTAPQSPLSFTQGQPISPQQFQQQFRQRCGVGVSGSTLVSGGATVDQLALFLTGPLAAAIENRTGLQGVWAFTLTFSRSGPSVNANADDLPDVFTAIQEQLGLKLQHEKKQMPVYVVDHIERPSEN